MSRVIFLESGGVKLDYIGAYNASTSNAGSHTFTGVDLGPSSSSGITVLGVGCIGLTTPLTGMTIGGNAATSVVTVAAPASQRSAGLYQYVGGGTANVTVNVSVGAAEWHLAVWKLRALLNTNKSASGSQAGNTGASLSISLDVPKYGAAIGFVVSDIISSNPSWTNLTRNFVQTSSFTNRSTGASATFKTAQTGLAVSATTPTAGFGFVAASWR